MLSGADPEGVFVGRGAGPQGRPLVYPPDPALGMLCYVVYATLCYVMSLCIVNIQR